MTHTADNAYRQLLATGRQHQPGQPCHYCGQPNPAEGPCPDCWTPIDVPTAKALFADVGLSVGGTTTSSEEQA